MGGARRELYHDPDMCCCAVCCPENTFGPKCEDCPGGPDSICGGRGKCLVRLIVYFYFAIVVLVVGVASVC